MQFNERLVQRHYQKAPCVVHVWRRYVPHRGGVNSSPDLVRWSMDLRFQATGTPTGRPHWPEFILQSDADPSIVQDSYDEWCERWIDGLASPNTDLHRQPPADVPLNPGDRVRIISLTTSTDELKKSSRGDLGLVEERLDETTYLLTLMDGSGTKTCARDELEVF